MRAANLSARGVSTRRFVIVAFVFLRGLPGLAAVSAQTVAPTTSAATNAPKVCPSPDAPTNVHSDYTLDPATVTFHYAVTRRPASEAIGIKPGKAPKAIKVKWASWSGAPASDAIVVRYDFTFNGIPCSFKYDSTPVCRKDDHYELKLDQFAMDLITQIDQLLPLTFNPTDPSQLLFGPVSVTVAPVLAGYQCPPGGVVSPTPTSTAQAQGQMIPWGVAAPAAGSETPHPPAPTIPVAKGGSTTSPSASDAGAIKSDLREKSKEHPERPVVIAQSTGQAPPKVTPQAPTTTTPSSQTVHTKLTLGSFVRTTNDLTIILQTSLGAQTDE